MIERKYLKDLGWSDELIDEAKEISGIISDSAVKEKIETPEVFTTVSSETLRFEPAFGDACSLSFDINSPIENNVADHAEASDPIIERINRTHNEAWKKLANL